MVIIYIYISVFQKHQTKKHVTVCTNSPLVYKRGTACVCILYAYHIHISYI